MARLNPSTHHEIGDGIKLTAFQAVHAASTQTWIYHLFAFLQCASKPFNGPVWNSVGYLQNFPRCNHCEVAGLNSSTQYPCSCHVVFFKTCRPGRSQQLISYVFCQTYNMPMAFQNLRTSGSKYLSCFCNYGFPWHRFLAKPVHKVGWRYGFYRPCVSPLMQDLRFEVVQTIHFIECLCGRCRLLWHEHAGLW